MVADLLGYITILLVKSNIFESLALDDKVSEWLVGIGEAKRTSIGLKGFAIRPMVDE